MVGHGWSCYQGAMLTEGKVNGNWKWGYKRLSLGIIPELVDYLTTEPARILEQKT